MNKESGTDASIAGPSGHISSDLETNSSSDSTFAVPAARKIKSRKRVFCLVWLENPAFKPWLQQLPSNPYKGKCSICNVTIRAMKSNLLRHGSSQEHIKNMKCETSSVERSIDESISTDKVTTVDVGTQTSTFTARKGWRQTFSVDWLEDPAFKPWLKQVPGDPHKGRCTFCNITIRAKKFNVQGHANTQEHMKNVKYRESSVERSTDETTSMDVGTESSSDGTFAVLATKRGRRQSFLPDWLEDPVFKPWLQQVQDDPYKGKCTFCNITIKAKKCNLLQHANSQKHIDNMKYGTRVVPGEGTRPFTDEVG